MQKDKSHVISDESLTGDKSRQKVELFASFSKVEKAEDDGFVYIEGYASTNNVDRHGDIIPPEVWNKKALKNFRKNPIVLFGHKYSEPVGFVTEISVDEKGLYVKCKIDAEDAVGRKIAKGILKTFSIGFYMLDFDYNPSMEAWVIKEVELLEVSVVSIPANQDATFSLAKQLGGESELKQLRQKLLGHNNNNKMEDKSWFQKTFGLGTTEADATKALKTVAAEKAALSVENENLKSEKAALAAEKTALSEDKHALQLEKEALEVSKNNLSAEVETLKTTATEKDEQIETLTTEKTALQTEVERLKSEIAKSKGVKKVGKDGSDPDLQEKEGKKFTSPNAAAAAKNLAALKNR